MNILRILDKLSNDKFFTGEATRSQTLSSIADFGKKAAVAAVPLGLAGLMSTPAHAETTATSSAAFATPLIDALQLALTLEYLEDEYYRMGLAKAGLIPSADRTIFTQIAKHETAHVAFLKTTLTALGTAPVTKPEFDFTAKGAFAPMDDYQTFLTLAQAFEDTGVRAYKGQAGNVMSNKDVLTAALQIHSVEARHASEVRRLRGQKGWIELAVGGNMPPATNAVYAGEGVTVQAGFNTATAFGPAAGSAAYDEPMSGSDATAIASLFIKS
ncbi:ferritin-like domain-containing protein [Epilithonimonas sp. JDS]|uniref:ferritin-like domain-containing protein n=1 Tax=Epilithonimonas sp. JDS TaxID=2902797 RepID=UPI001E6226C6|nr:ferritin-like domain-containing protein [Epilithonimonas sp. JDS]MCD9856297.1 ferritin-like domain-containing protein [Epilithonimonas sp. JDS]